MSPPGADQAQVITLPSTGEVIADQRGDGRWMRVSWHEEAGDGLVVLSLWRESGCVGTMRLARDQVPALVSALVDGLARPAFPGRPAHDVT